MEIKTAILMTGCIFLCFFGIPLRIKDTGISSELNFKEYIIKYNKSYNLTDYEKRFEAYKEALARINVLNNFRSGNSSALFGVTKFSDLTTDEFIDKHLQQDLHHRISQHILRASVSSNYVRKRAAIALPLKVDWREKGVLTAVNNQKLCGACWAFCTVETIEAMYAMQTHKLQKFSVQEAIDCAKNNNQGCNGGDMCSLLDWMVTNKINLRTEEEYPLELRTNQCKLNNTVKGVEVSKYACQNLINNEDALLNILATHGPVAVAINAITWQNYLGGVIQYHCDGAKTLMNHAVQIVGYDKTAEIPYYIVRNSWGPDFGDKGYLYLAIGNNMCGLANEVASLWIS